MALIKCSECGKEISDKANACIHCGCPIEEIIKCEECGKELKSEDKVCKSCGCPVSEQKNMAVDLKNVILNKVSNLSTYLKLGIVLGVGILVLVLVLVLKNDKPNIVGVWINSSSLSGGVTFEKKLNFEDGKHATLTNIVTDRYGKETSREFDCTYEFRNDNTEIKLSCEYDTEDIKEKNNIWVNFEMEGDAIYIDNDKYVHFSR